MWRMMLVLAWPLAEIAAFVVIGGEIGVWAVLGWILLTAILGVFLLRVEIARGAVLLRGGGPGQVGLREGAPVAGLFRALAAVLLILPGFLTDAAGIVLLLPPVQGLLTGMVMRRVRIVTAGMESRAAEDVIDGEWVEVPPAATRGSTGGSTGDDGHPGSARPPSKWVGRDD
ncbi:FxsA family protein [Pseudogemmobacter sonorensis]|uniref:FxsA family protein n=1 Tax=Pseudogemmobacter sonorensis TaxID=2989681 RepID=UPI0036AC3DEA